MKVKKAAKTLLWTGSVGAVVGTVAFAAVGDSHGVNDGGKLNVVTEEQYIKYLWHSDFDESFIYQALKAIDWSESKTGVLKAGAFEGTEIPRDYILPQQLTKIEDEAFKNATLKDSFVIPQTVVSIGHRAFQGANIAFRFNFTETTEEIGVDAFKDLKLQDGFDFIVPNWHTLMNLRKGGYEDSTDGGKIILADDFVIPENIPQITQNTFHNVVLPYTFTIPESVDSIDEQSFKNAYLPLEFKIPETLINIHSNAFDSIVLHDGYVVHDWTTLTGLRKGGYGYENHLRLGSTFSTPRNYDEIGEMDFYNVQLPDKFSIPESVITIDPSAFVNSTVTPEFVVPDWRTLKGLREGGIDYDTQLPLWSEFQIPSDITSIDDITFRNTKLPMYFKVPEIDDIDPQAFANVTLEEGFKIWDWNTLVALRQGGLSGRLDVDKSFSIPRSVDKITKANFNDLNLPWNFEIPDTTIVETGTFTNISLDDKFVLKDWWTLKGLKTGGYTNQKPLILSHEFTIQRFDDPSEIWDGVFDNVAIQEGFFVKDYWTIRGLQLGGYDEIHGRLVLWSDFTIDESVVVDPQVDGKVFETVGIPSNFLVKDWWTLKGLRLGGLDDDKHLFLAPDFEIPEVETTIHEFAFYNTTLPEGFTIPDTITTIQDKSFWYSVLSKGFTIPEAVHTNGGLSTNAFTETTLKVGFSADDWWTLRGLRFGGYRYEKNITLTKGFVIPDNVSNIVDRAFENTNLPEGFTLHDNVTSIGRDAFKRTSLPVGFKIFNNKAVVNPEAFSKNTTIEAGFEVLNWWTLVGLRKGGYAYTNPLKLTKDFIIPDAIPQLNTSQFENVTIQTGFTIPRYLIETTNAIAPDTFTKLLFLTKEFVVLDYWTLVGLRMGGYDADLNDDLILDDDFEVPTDTDTIHAYAFYKTILPDGFNIRPGVHTIMEHAFKEVKLPNGFKIPDTVTTIDKTAFNTSYFEDVTKYLVPDYWTLTGLRKGGFGVDINNFDNYNVDYYIQLTLAKDFVFPNVVENMIDRAFEFVIIPAGFTLNVDGVTLKTIGEYAFRNTSIPFDFEIPESAIDTNSIASNAFSDSTLLSAAGSPSFVVNDFWTLRGLRKGGYGVVYNSNGQIDYFNNDLTLHSGFVIPDNVTIIEAHAFERTITNNAFTLGDTGIVEIQEHAFKNTSLKDQFVINKGAVTIAYNAFSQTTLIGADAKTPFKVQNWWTLTGLRKGGYGVVYDSAQNVMNYNQVLHLASGFEIPLEISELSARSFQKVMLSPEFEIPNWVTTIGANAFKDTMLNVGLTIPKETTTIENTAFQFSQLDTDYESMDWWTLLGLRAGGYPYSKIIVLNSGFYIPIEINEVRRIESLYFKNVQLQKEFKVPEQFIYDPSYYFAPDAFAQINDSSYGGSYDKYTVSDWWTLNALRYGGNVDRLTLVSDFIIPVEHDNILLINEKAFKNVVIPVDFEVPKEFIYEGGTKTIHAQAFSTSIFESGFTVNDWWTMRAIRIGGYLLDLELSTNYAIDDLVTEIPANAFYKFKLNMNFQLPERFIWVNNVASNKVHSTSFVDVELPDGYKVKKWWTLRGFRIGGYSYSKPLDLDSGFVIDKGKNVTHIDAQAFENTNIQWNPLSSHEFWGDITSIGSRAFAFSTTLAFNIPSKITTIEDEAFYNARFNGTVNYNPSISFIPRSTFENATFATKLIIGNGISVIRDSAFKNASISGTLELSAAVETIEANAFNTTRFQTDGLVIHEDVANVAANSFVGATFPTTYKVTKWWTYKVMRKGGQTSKFKLHSDFAVPETELDYVKNQNNIFATSQISLDSEYFVSDWWTLLSLREGEYDYTNPLQLRSGFTMPSHVSIISARAFEYVTIQSGFVIPSTINEMADDAFKMATFRGAFAVPSTITRVGASTFKLAKFEVSLTYNAAIDEIVDSTFEQATIKSITITNNQITTIGIKAFYNATIENEFAIPAWITHIKKQAFHNDFAVSSTPNTYKMLSSNITTFDELAFKNSKVSLWTSNTNVTIGISAFEQVEFLSNFVMPTNITTISNFGFRNATFHSSIILSNSLTTINTGAFQFATFLSDFKVDENVDTILQNAFASVNFNPSYKVDWWWTYKALRRGNNTQIFVLHKNFYVPEDELSYVQGINGYFSESAIFIDTEYTLFDWWTLRALREGDYPLANNLIAKSGFSIPSNVTTIGVSHAQNVVFQSGFVIPGTVDEILNSGFSYSTFNGNFVIPSTITNMGQFTFASATFKGTLDYSVSQNETAHSAFKNATFASSILFNNPMTTVIGAETFMHATFGGIKFSLPSRITTIKTSAFEVTESDVLSIEMINSSLALIENRGLARANIVSWTTSQNGIVVGVEAFMESAFETTFAFPSGVALLGVDSFNSAQFKGDIVLPGSIHTIGTGAFRYANFAKDFDVAANITTINTNGFNGIYFDPAYRVDTWWTHKALRRGNFTSKIWLHSDFYVPKEELPFVQLDTTYFNSSKVNLTNYTVFDWWTLRALREGGYAASNQLTLKNNFEMPAEVDTILNSAFINTVIQSGFFLPRTILNVEKFAFKQAQFQDAFTLPDTVNDVGDNVFESAIFGGNMTFNASINSLPQSTFNTSTFNGSITITNRQIQSLGNDSFVNSKHTSTFQMPTWITNIGQRVFQNTNGAGGGYLNIEMVNSEIATISDSAFAGTQISRWTSASAAIVIGSAAFSSAQFTSTFEMPKNITTIGNDAFSRATFNSNILLSGNLNSVASGAFTRAIFNNDFEVEAQINAISTNSFNLIQFAQGNTIEKWWTYKALRRGSYISPLMLNSQFTIDKDEVSSIAGGYFRDNLQTTVEENYTVKDWWTLKGLRQGSYIGSLALSTDFRVPDDVTIIESNAMKDVTLNSTFSIPSHVTTIKSNAFRNAYFTGSFTVPSTVTLVETMAFYASNFQKVFTYNGGETSIQTSVFEGATFSDTTTIGSHVTSLQSKAFYNANFTNVLALPTSLTNIGDNAFYRVDITAQQNRISIPHSVTTIGDSAFHNTSIVAWASGTSNVTVSANAFKESTFETNVNLPTKLLSIDTNSFENTVFEGNITIPTNVNSIGVDAFKGASFKNNLAINASTPTITSSSFSNVEVLGTATIGSSSITAIEANAFDGARFKNKFTLPETITSIGHYSFRNTSTSNTFGIPSSVTSIGQYAFQSQIIDSWSSSSTGTVSINTNTFRQAEFTTNFRMPTHISSIGSYAFTGATFNGPINFSDTLTTISSNAFDSANINSTFVLASLPTVGSNAFRNLIFPSTPFSVTNWFTFEAFRKGGYQPRLSLADTFRIPENVSGSIEANRFSFANVEIPTSFRVLDWWTLVGMRTGSCSSNLTLSNSFIIPSNVNTITTAIANTVIPSGFILPPKVTTINSGAFVNSTFNGAFTIPNTVTSIGASGTFNNATFIGDFILNANSAITSIGTSMFENSTFNSGISVNSASNTLTSIGDSAFKNAKLASEFDIPSSVKIIGNDAFYRTDVSSSRNKFTIPSSLTSLGSNSFKNATFDNAVTLPSSLTTMGSNAFDNAIFNNSFTSNAGLVSIGTSAFANAAFKSTAVWNGSALTSIGDSAFQNATFNQTFTIPNSVTTIGSNAFMNSTTKNTFNISTGASSIGSNAFNNQKIQSWNSASGTAKTIGSSAFENASFLSDFTIPAGWATIQNRAFANATFSGKVTIPTSVTSIGNSLSISRPFINTAFNGGILFNGQPNCQYSPFSSITISPSYRIENWYTLKALREGGYTGTLTVANTNFSFPADYEVATYQHWKWLRDASFNGMLTLGVGFTIPGATTINSTDFANSKTSVASTYKVPNYTTLKGLRDGGYTGDLDGTTMTGVASVEDFATYKMIRDTGYTARIDLEYTFTIPSDVVIPTDYFTSAKITLPYYYEVPDWYTLKGLREGGYTGTLTVSSVFILPNGFTCDTKTHWDYLRAANFNGRITVGNSFVVPSGQTGYGTDLDNKITLPSGYRVPDYTTYMWLINGGYTGSLTVAPGFTIPSDVLFNTYAEYKAIRDIGFNGTIYVSSSFKIAETDIVTSTTFAGTKLGLPGGYSVPDYWTLKKLRDGGCASTLTVSPGFVLPQNYKVESYSDWSMIRNASYTGILTLGNNFTIPSNIVPGNSEFDNTKVNIPADFRVKDWYTFIGLTKGGYTGTLTVSDDFTLPADYKANDWSEWELLQSIGYNGNITIGTNFTIPSGATITPGSFANNKITLADGFEVNDFLTIKGLREGGYTDTLTLGNAFNVSRGTIVPTNLFSDSTTSFVSGYKTKNIWTLSGLRAGGYTGVLTLSTSFAIDPSVTSLEANSFANVVLNPSFTIPTTVLTIDETAFTGATLNGQLISETNPLTWGSDTWWPNKPPVVIPEEPITP